MTRIPSNVQKLIADFDYCLDKDCLVCATLTGDRIKDVTDTWSKTGKCGELAEVAVEMLPREARLTRRIRSRIR